MSTTTDAAETTPPVASASASARSFCFFFFLSVNDADEKEEEVEAEEASASPSRHCSTGKRLTHTDLGLPVTGSFSTSTGTGNRRVCQYGSDGRGEGRG